MSCHYISAGFWQLNDLCLTCAVPFFLFIFYVNTMAPAYRTLKGNGTAEKSKEVGEGSSELNKEEHVGMIRVGFDLSADPIPITWKDIFCFAIRTKVGVWFTT